MRVTHVALDLGLRHECRDRVDHDDIDSARADEDLADLHRLLTGVGLRDEEVLDIDAELDRVVGVERVLGVDVGGGSARLLRVGNDVEAERGLAARLRTVDLGHAATRDSTDADGGVEVDGARGDRIDADARIGRAHLHDRALAMVLFDLRDRQAQGLLLVFLNRRNSHLAHPVVRRLRPKKGG